MIIAIQETQETEVTNILFKRLYLCAKKDPIELLETEYISDFISYDNGIPTNINDPFLLSFIYAN